ncbi:MAG: metallophosphoesterase [Candidatus Coatesbacteria bacterium]|nr:metallophosphoesterase [Candidatus Coatesbacteria bacterium]
MKIGILSDSHDNLQKVKAASEIFRKSNAGLIIHAGDIVAPFTLKPLLELNVPVYAVRGNNDGEVILLNNLIARTNGRFLRSSCFVKWNDIRIAIFHEQDIALELKDCPNFDLVVFGHTHEIFISKGKPLILNPGESCGILSGRSTAAIVSVDNNNVMDAEILDL